MRALITGAGGQLGRALLATAPASADLTAIGHADVDLADNAMLRARLAVEAPDIILNAAAYTAVDQAEGDEETARAINADAVAIMARTQAETGGRLVHISTDFVFDGRAPRAYRPDDERAPLSAYGRSKAEGEDHCRPADLLVRTAWVYAAGGRNFVRTMLRLMHERGEIAVVADQIGAPTWATGLARTIWALVDSSATGTYHHSDAGTASWYDFAVAIAEEAHARGLIERMPKIRPIATAEYPTLATRPAFSLLDSSATRAELGDEYVHWRTHLRVMLEEEKALG
ncbi:dTDP-4-dehydrorhamnose reductase [Erythrobacter sp.]|uniref:dTDP-4-dehydrorhamnose reductase n=1 Tax=Erythrobacter sp. TaxID=1042 RepID=UPI002EAECC29|nr:dTDP-4-dehydrorhamnose reductase [Erythrobacter sp.]